MKRMHAPLWFGPLIAGLFWVGPAAASPISSLVDPSPFAYGTAIVSFTARIPRLLPHSSTNEAWLTCLVSAGQVACSVCTSSDEHTFLPVYAGNPGQGDYGVGVGGPDGHGLLSFGPYVGVWVGNC
jgi:hypothetical protein